MKKNFLYLLVAICVCVLSSCRVVVDDTVTGDVKEQGEIVSPDILEMPKENETDTELSGADEEKEIIFAEEMAHESVEKLLKPLDAVMAEGGEYYADAVRLCEAAISKDAETFAEFTGGRAEYYDFLSKAEIASYELIPFEIVPETLESHIYHGNYPVASDNYLVEFDVISSDCEEFAFGECIYYAGFDMNPLSGNLLSVFVPWEEAEKNMLDRSIVPFTEAFAKEFASLYPVQSPLFAGKNYADSFDFTNHHHLVTHLMASDKNLGIPPYTYEEVNEFILTTFDGNDGITLSEINSGGWTSAWYDSDYEDGRIYGCSYAHGGSSVVCKVVNTEKDGSRERLTLDIYADFSKVAKAYTLVFYFDNKEDERFCLTMVEKLDDTGRQAAVWSV